MRDDVKEMFTGSTSVLAIVGAALFWLWMDAGVFSSTLLGPGGAGMLFKAMFLATTLVTVVVFVIPLVGLAPIDRSTVSRRWRLLSVPTGLSGVVGSVALIVAGNTGSLPLAIVGSVLNGICFGHLNVMWGWVCVAQGHAKAVLHISAAWALSLPFNLLFAVLPATASGVVVALLPIVSVVVYQMVCALQDKPVYRIEPVSREPIDLFGGRGLVFGFDARLVALILVFCAVFGLMYYLQIVVPPSASTAQAGLDLSVGVVGIRGLTALVFFIASLTVLRDHIQALFKVCFYILVAGLSVMVVGVFVPEFRVASPYMVAVGYCGFDILVWTMVAFHSYVTDNLPAKNVIVAMLAEQTGIALGALIGAGIRGFGLSTAVETGVIMTLDLVAIAVLVGYTEYGSRLWTMLVNTSIGSDEAFRGLTGGGAAVLPAAAAENDGDPDADAGGRDDEAAGFSAAMASLAKTYGLTRRELEITSVFVQGRSMSYIAEKLFVSENTVKTHIRHAYAKCGVHNKQELIDLVEGMRR